MKKLKLKKKARNSLLIVTALIIIFIVLIIAGIKIKEKFEYENSYEYKLIEKGYKKEFAKDLDKNLKDKEKDYLLKNDINDIIPELIKDKYFIYDKFYDYIDYYKENTSLDVRKTVEMVNARRNKEYYTDTIKTDISKKELMLVNKYYYLEKDYEPENLITVPTTYAWGTPGYQRITKVTYDAFLNMWASAKQAGFQLMVNSSYRDYTRQEEIYNEYKNARGEEYADNYAARAGHSEHQTGYTLDISEIKNTNKDKFHETEVYQWLLDNAHKFGFILRCREDKEDVTGYKFESWHYRYVGEEAARYIHDNDITFEEYYAYFVDKK